MKNKKRSEFELCSHEVYLEGEIGVLYELTYALIDRGDGTRCGWCDKKNLVEEHLNNHERN